MGGRKGEVQDETYSRREVLAALAKYSAVVGGTATTIISADGLVSAASAYWPSDKLRRFCAKNPTHWKCTGGGNPGNGNGAAKRIDF